ncbi:MAG: beta-galactosidase small subunit [Sphaerochaetaceae bacterium]|jgi:beta-galactosidase
MDVVYGDVTLGVHGKDFDYIFSYQTGGPESFVAGGLEWLYRTPKPTFWRATTCNDRGSHFPHKASMWMGADMFIETTGVEVLVDDAPLTGFLAPDNSRLIGSGYEHPASVEVRYTYATTTVPSATVTVGYRVVRTGDVLVLVRYEGVPGLPELPAFGMRFVMPSLATGYDYRGLEGETYPDRMAGARRGTFSVSGVPLTPYLVPQECGMHMDTDFVIVSRTGTGDRTARLTFRRHDRRFAFSLLPYTALELENATHQEELPPARRTVLCVMGAVRGVGGIDSWGSDVEPAYRIPSDQDIVYSFVISPSQR